MKTTEEILLEMIAEVNHAEALSDLLKEALPPGTPLEIVRMVNEIYSCVGRIQIACGELQHSQGQAGFGSLTMPPSGFVAQN